MLRRVSVSEKYGFEWTCPKCGGVEQRHGNFLPDFLECGRCGQIVHRTGVGFSAWVSESGGDPDVEEGPEKKS